MNHSVYLGDGIALTKTVFDAKMYVDATDGGVSPHLLMGGVWETWLTEYVGHHIGPGMTVVDVGAHTGWYSLFAALRVAPHGRVYAFEPNPRLVALLERSVVINGLERIIRVERAAVVDVDRHGDELALTVPDGYSSGASVLSGFAALPDGGARALRVPAVALDRYFDAERVDFLKIDAEGSEPSVLEGARELLARSPRAKLFIEHHAGDGEAFESLWQRGYKSYTIDPSGLHCPITTHDELARLPDAHMLFCLR